MTNPPLRDLEKRVDSKYTLVIAAAKRARQIVARKEPVIFPGQKPVTIALEEIAEGKVKIVPKKPNKAAG